MPQHVLIIDDDLFMRKLIEVMLKRDGYEIQKAASVEEAMQILSTSPVHAITCDLMMPDVDGLSFLKKLKAAPEYQTIPVVIITAAGLQDSIQKAITLGAVSVVEKPFTDAQLRAAVYEAIQSTSN